SLRCRRQDAGLNGTVLGYIFSRCSTARPRMNEADIARIADWIVHRGLAGDDETSLLRGFCKLCVKAGLDMSDGTAIIDTLHPVYEGRVFSWSRENPGDARVTEYLPVSSGNNEESWRQSPFYYLLESGNDEVRR